MTLQACQVGALGLNRHSIAITALFAFALFLSMAGAQTLPSAPAGIVEGTNNGPASGDKFATVTVYLKLRNQADFDKKVEDLYDPASGSYHRWMSPDEIASYGATAEDMATVKQSLQSSGLTVLETDLANSVLRARGTLSQLETAFQTQIHAVEKNGQVLNSAVVPASLPGTAGDLVKAVAGLSNFQADSNSTTQVPSAGNVAAVAAAPTAVPALAEGYFTNDCFGKPQTYLLTSPVSSPLPPTYQYKGNVYQPTAINCAWTPAQIRSHYGLEQVYKAGYEGQGQSIVIVEPPSHGDEVTQDLTAFSQWAGLPAITSNNFEVVYPEGVPDQSVLYYLDETVDADLQTTWAHVIAPRAKIVLVIMPTSGWSQLEFAIRYAVTSKLGNIMNVLYRDFETDLDSATVTAMEQTLEFAAAAGIAVNAPSGDYGDNSQTLRNPSAVYPATSAWVTAVGGTSIGIPKSGGGTAEVGWGKTITALTDYSLQPLAPVPCRFAGGSGGGESALVAKPHWQRSLPGTGRQEPDIAALADPDTGALSVHSSYHQQGSGSLEPAGGTSLATAIFSGFWALATQKAGSRLGQAARRFESIHEDAITDIVPLSSPTNVTGFQVASTGTTPYSADYLACVSSTGPENYFSALNALTYYVAPFTINVFGTDTKLRVTKGWDNVTGWGVPNGYKFVSAAGKRSDDDE